MTNDDTARHDPDGIPPGDMEFADEEDTGGQATPGKDLGSACVIGGLAIAVMVIVYSDRLSRDGQRRGGRP